MKTDFIAANETKKTIRGLLEGAGIKARYTVTLSDQGSVVDVHVPAKQYGLARQLLPFTIGAANVFFHKDLK